MKYLVISIKGSAAYIVGNKTVYFLKEYSLRSEAYNTVEWQTRLVILRQNNSASNPSCSATNFTEIYTLLSDSAVRASWVVSEILAKMKSFSNTAAADAAIPYNAIISKISA